jgi:proteic killer suppression protein
MGEFLAGSATKFQDCIMSRDMIQRKMIVSFRHRGLQRLFEKGDRSKLSQELVGKIEVILAALDAAAEPQDLERPSFHLHQLVGDRKGEWSITVRANWRIVFRFEGQDVCDVELIDYH